MRLNPSPSTTTSVPPSVDAPDHPAPASAPNRSSPATDLDAKGIFIDIYRSTTDRSKYLSVVGGTDIASMAFPADMDTDLHSVSPYKEGVEIQSGKPAMGLDVEDILGQLGRQGFAVHGLKFSASLSMGVGIGRGE
jgi:hypothetical protein